MQKRPLKMYLNSLAILEKASNYLKKALHHFKKASILLKMSSSSLVIFKKSLRVLIKAFISLKMSLINPRYLRKSLTLSLIMHLKSLKIVQNASHYWKKPPFLFKRFKKPQIF
jgi:hypothetical protein